MVTGKSKKKKRNYRDIEFDESIYEEALARKKVLLLKACIRERIDVGCSIDQSDGLKN